MYPQKQNYEWIKNYIWKIEQNNNKKYKLLMWLIQTAATENLLLYFAREYSEQPTDTAIQHTGASFAGASLS
jgi:hypothetical protein